MNIVILVSLLSCALGFQDQVQEYPFPPI